MESHETGYYATSVRSINTSPEVVFISASHVRFEMPEDLSCPHGLVLSGLINASGTVPLTGAGNGHFHHA